MIVEQKFKSKNGNRYIVSGAEEFSVGDRIKALPADDFGTEKQNKLFHKLLHDIYLSRAWSFSGLTEKEHECVTWLHFRDLVKLHYGEGADYYVFVDNFGFTQYSKKRPNPQICKYCFAFTKSWADYTKEQRSMCIDRVLNWADSMGVGYLTEGFRRESNN